MAQGNRTATARSYRGHYGSWTNRARSRETDGGNGLSFYHAWGSGLHTLLKPDGVFFCEIDDYVSKHINSIMAEHFNDIAKSRDISGRLRVCEATTKRIIFNNTKLGN